MAQITYIQAVNKVLTKLRESSAGSINDSNYISLVASFINDAKREVEDAWDWSVLRQPTAFNSVALTQTYDLSQGSATVTNGIFTNERSRLARVPGYSRLPMAFDVTPNQTLQMYDVDAGVGIRDILIISPGSSGQSPTEFYIEAVGDGIRTTFLDAPTGIRNYKFYFVNPQDDLETDSQTITVPWRPVVALATLYALNERGEEMGEPGGIAERRYYTALGDAIQLDASIQEHKMQFTPD